jgi:large subunit ribosomal protein L21
MYAIVNIAGQQLKVEKDQHVFVNRLPNKEGDKVTFEEVLLVDNDGKISVGAPAVSGATVTAKVIEHLKGDKVKVFKKKRRKGYQTLNGHRQLLTKISIDGIALGGTKKSAAKAEEQPKAEAKPESKSEAKPKAKVKSKTDEKPVKKTEPASKAVKDDSGAEKKAEAKPEGKTAATEKPKAQTKKEDAPAKEKSTKDDDKK